MASPTLVFNTGTGSDSAASGAGPASALSGSGAVTAGSTTVDLSADSPDLSGVATDGSAVLYVATSSGRQFAKITAVNNTLKTVTVLSAYATSESGRNWAIGGKRATFQNSGQLFTDCGAEWIIETETDQSLTSEVQLAATGPSLEIYMATIRGSSGSLKTVTKTWASAAQGLFYRSSGSYWRLHNLKLLDNSATKGPVVRCGNTSGWIFTDGCQVGDGTDSPTFLISRVAGYAYLYLHNSTCIGSKLVDDCWYTFRVVNSLVLDAPSHAIIAKLKGSYSIIENSAFVNCANYGALFNSEDNVSNLVILNSVLHGGASANMRLNRRITLYLQNSHITGSSGYGIAYSGALYASAQQQFRHNNWYGNASGNVEQGTIGADDTTTDPEFVDAANGDITPAASFLTAGAPSTFPGLGFSLNRAIGPVHASGSGSGQFNPFRGFPFGS